MLLRFVLELYIHVSISDVTMNVINLLTFYEIRRILYLTTYILSGILY